jgi:hypothetical protein
MAANCGHRNDGVKYDGLPRPHHSIPRSGHERTFNSSGANKNGRSTSAHRRNSATCCTPLRQPSKIISCRHVDVINSFSSFFTFARYPKRGLILITAGFLLGTAAAFKLTTTARQRHDHRLRAEHPSELCVVAFARFRAPLWPLARASSAAFGFRRVAKRPHSMVHDMARSAVLSLQAAELAHHPHGYGAIPATRSIRARLRRSTEGMSIASGR